MHLKTKITEQVGRTISRQFSADAFNFLAVLLPAQHQRLRNVTPRMWLIPMRVLIERRLAGRTGVWGSTLCLYPHRPAQAGTKWLDNFMIDLTSPLAALDGHRRIVGG